MNAISYLRSEHNKFRRTLKTLSKITNLQTKQDKFYLFCDELSRHEAMEEKIWYPALRKHPELRDIIKHLVSEEKSAKQAMRKFKKTSFDFMWQLRFYKLKHDIEHHANEEEKELFPKVRKILTQKELNALGVKMRKFKSA